MDEEQRIAGYRVLRRLARGARTSILLAHGGEPPATVVLKEAPADDPGAFRESAALDLGAGEHVIPVLDAHADDERVVLVLPRLDGGDLARLLADRAELAGGEAVTVLAPIAATVRRLHRAGVAHGALTAAAVLFDADGAPILTGFGSAAVFAAGAPEIELERVPEVGADRAAVLEIASAVLERVGGDRRPAARGLLADLRTAPVSEAADRLAQGIFDVAAALPVRSGEVRAGEEVANGGGGRIVPVAAAIETGGTLRAGWWERLADALDRAPAAELRAALARRWESLPRSRRRVVLAIGAGALALVVAVLAIPEAGVPRAAAGPRPSALAASTASAAASPAVAGPSGSAAGSGQRDAAMRGADPVAAANALLAARAACRRELSVLCLDDVDQDGSAAADADRDAVRAAQTGGELPDDPLPSPDTAAPRLTERLGGSALIGLDGGASILLVDGDDGWRIRDLLPAPGRTPAPSPRG